MLGDAKVTDLDPDGREGRNEDVLPGWPMSTEIDVGWIRVSPVA